MFQLIKIYNGHLTRLAHYSYFGCSTTIIMFYFLTFESHITVKIVEINNVGFENDVKIDLKINYN